MSRIDVHETSQAYFARIHRAALVLCGNPSDADDLAQETFLVLAKQKDRFQGRSSVYTWLYGILLNLDRRERRRIGTRYRKLHSLWNDQSPHQCAEPRADERVETKEWNDSLWAKVAELSPGQRQALILRFREGLRYDEIARKLNCPLGTVKSRIFHGLAALRKQLADETLKTEN